MIEISHLSKKYGSHLAVDDISFTAEPGKIYGFLGPNGAGKSTTMNIITGYIGATSGTVTVNGKDIFRDAIEAKSQIGYLPEIPPLYVDMTVREYLDFSAELKKIKKSVAKSQIDEIMELTKIVDVSERLIKNLSKGYRQRVGLACALLGYPEVIILDEPSVGLDPEQIIEMRDLIRSLKDDHTVILSSHILSEVQEVCDYVFIINKGRLVAADNIDMLEANLSGEMKVNITVKGSEGDVKKVMDGFADVTYSAEASKEEGCCDITVVSNDGSDVRAELSTKLVNAGLPILFMSKTEHSLEDIFLEVTKNDEADNEVSDEDFDDDLSDDISENDEKEVQE